jgi:excisionase family DNA binding protein
MGEYPNRTEERAGAKHSHGADAKSKTASRAGIQAGAGASGQSAPAIEPITLRVPDACRYIGISRSTLYVLIAEGEIEIIKLGCSTLVLTESLKILIAQRRRRAENSSAHSGD